MKQSIRLVVFGGRDFNNPDLLNHYLNHLATLYVIEIGMDGDARGADRMGRDWGKRRAIPWLIFKAEWTRYGGPAGPIRNQRIIDEGRPSYGVAFPDGVPGHNGTADMTERCRIAGVPVWEIPS